MTTRSYPAAETSVSELSVSEKVIAVKNHLIALQNSICSSFEECDGQTHFKEDAWQHSENGGGLTRVLEKGKVFEKGAVNFSHVQGSALPQAATLQRPELSGRHFQATGVSIVMHPDNPYVPTTHFNCRFIVAEKENEKPLWWFGGGFDLTPYYGFDEDCEHWHRMAKQLCDPFGIHVYPHFKKWCDDYFYLKNRNEPRGIGGLFFDDLNEWGFERCFSFFKGLGEHFMLAYLPIVSLRKNTRYGSNEKEFQLYRRGRYVEFNLLYDRGTLFGLQSKGRTESILCSLPPQVSWKYDWKPEPNSKEALLYSRYLQAKDWI